MTNPERNSHLARTLVGTLVKGKIGIITIDNPPVNALGADLRYALFAALKGFESAEEIKAVAIVCAGRTFVAGADIGELGTARQLEYPQLPDICAFLESMSKPVVAAIHGTAFGGGLELTLPCHFRIMTSDASVGLTEVKLGFIPGSGGTVRLPRLVGPEKAVEMIVTGKGISAAEALEFGLVDKIVTGDLSQASEIFLQDVISSGAPLLPTRSKDAKVNATLRDPAQFQAISDRLLAKSKGERAQAACVEAVRRAFTLPFDEALKIEREIFTSLVTSPESKALRHLFFAQRDATKIPGVPKDTAPRDVRHIGIVGGGTMGGGIAMAFANAGYAVTILELNSEALERGLKTIHNNYAVSVSRGSLSEDARQQRIALIAGVTDYAALGHCDLIIEAVVEDLAVKKKVFESLAAIAKPSAIIATNTSYLDVDALASSSGRPVDVVGLHFFSPANVMPLLEIVRGKQTSPAVIRTAVNVGQKIGKVPVVVGVCHGFVGNRMLSARSAELEYLLLEGSSPAEVDRVFTDFGWPMGPFQMYDLSGLDIGWLNRRSRGLKAPIADALCEMGRFGQKAGKGWYAYEPSSRSPKADPAVAELIETEARKQGIARRKIGAEEIVERTLLPLINEGTKILEENVASRKSDIDLVWVNGYGFPKTLGGPMYWAEAKGMSVIAQRLKYWFDATGRAVFEPSKTLREL
ncbi:3-hydroxyacyl-CoA dehydrogenase NAD-binding domain-containing protein [Agrobacterium vitis]